MVRTWLSGKNWKRGSGEGEEEFPRLVIKLGTRLGSGVKHGIIQTELLGCWDRERADGDLGCPEFLK